MPFGDCTIPEDVPYWEFLDISDVSATPGMSQGAVGQWTIASFTMPWLGWMMARTALNGSFPAGVMSITCWLTTSTPAPGANFVGTFTSYNGPGDGWETCDSMAQWQNVAKGTAVSIVHRLEIGTANVLWYPKTIARSIPRGEVLTMPRRFGDMKVSEDYPQFEQWFHSEMGTVIPNATGQTFYLGAFVMPWAGRACAEMTLMAGWAGYQHCTVQLAASSPGPAAYSWFNRIAECAADSWAEIPIFARWDNLTAGQSVAVYCYVGVGGGGAGVNAARIAGSVRAYPT